MYSIITMPKNYLKIPSVRKKKKLKKEFLIPLLKTEKEFSVIIDHLSQFPAIIRKIKKAIGYIPTKYLKII
jgi:hypothetical protein